MAKIDDAYDRLSSAQKLMESGDYAGAITEAQMCMELSLKAFLDALEVDYTRDDRGKKRFLHDVSSKVYQGFEELKSCLHRRHEGEYRDIERDLTKAAVLSSLLWTLRNYCQYGVAGFKEVGAKDIFDYNFGKDIAEVLVKKTGESHWRIKDLVRTLADASHSEG